MTTPIIDTHIHLFDPRRPQGVPWPPKDQIIYQPALPELYRSVTSGLGVVGAIEVECSPWQEDNQWVLDVAAGDTIIVGKVGDLIPGGPDFRRLLEGFLKNPLFLGIRYGNLWDRNLAEEMSRPEFVADLKLLADAGLELDTANPDLDLLAAVIRLSDQVPSLRIVVDHLPQFAPPPEAEAELEAKLRELGGRPQIYFKISEVLRRVGGQVRTDLDFYRPRLDQLWSIFGEDRLLYGSDWPNSDLFASYPQVLSIARDYFAAKGPAVMEKVFWKNSVSAYRWVKRAENQPSFE